MNLSSQLLIIILLASATAAKSSAYPEGMWPLHMFGDFSSAEQEVLAYFDFNRDRYVDMVTQSNHNTLNIYLWSSKQNRFEVQASMSTNGLNILSVITSNFTNNNRIDLIVTFQAGEGAQNQAMVYSVRCDFKECEILGSSLSPFQLVLTPTVMQIQGANTLLYSDGQNIMAKTSSWQSSPFNSQKYLAQGNVGQLCPVFSDMFYLDYTGDCIQDIVVHCADNRIQFLSMDRMSKFTMVKEVQLSSYAKVLSVGMSDIDFDGLVDLLVVFANEQGLILVEIHYHTGVKSLIQSCQLETGAKTFPYHFVSSDGQLNKSGTTKIHRVGLGLAVEDSGDYLFRMGDLNNDGYTDMIVDTGLHSTIFVNQRCEGADCGSYNPEFVNLALINDIRTFYQFRPTGLATSSLSFCSMSFFDLYEDGHLDVIGVECKGERGLRTGKITPILNSLVLDAFFMKITVLANMNNQKVKQDAIDLRLNSYGGHVSFFVNSLSGERKSASGDQLSNPGRSLQLPYIHIGLGRTNNYVENLEVSISRKTNWESHLWTPIVPNSQLVIVPGPKWVLQAFISPTEIMGTVFWFVVLTLIGIGMVIIKLTKEEKAEDKEKEDSFYAILR